MIQTLSIPRNTLTALRYLIAALILLATASVYYLISTQPAAAATTPESCFAFNAGTGTITNYYNHENNNPANPACPRDVDIPSTIGGVAVTAIGAATNVSNPATATSFARKSLTTVVIPNSVTSIGNNAFSYNQLTTVTIPNSVTSIGASAFSYNQLTTVTIPDGVTIISTSAFRNNQLTTVTIPNNVTSIGPTAFTDNQLTTVTIPNSVTSIGASAFASNQLTTVTIPDGVTIIGTSAFSYNQLTTVTIPNSVTSIGSSAFSFNQLTTLTLGSSVTSIGSSAFSGNQLTTLTLPDGVTSIGDYAFYGNHLTTLTLPDGVTSIGDYAFYGNQLTTLTLGSSVTSIGNAAFSFNQLTSVTIPNSVTSIGKSAFAVQNQFGSDLEKDNGIGPYIWSDNPAEIQAAYEEIWYVQLYTEDPSNPNNLTDGVVSESDWWGGDENEDGEDDSFGGHLINPAAAEVSYKNASGTELQASLTSVGQLPNGDRIQTYYADQGPRLFNTYNPTPEEIEATRQALTAYYRLNDELTFTPPSISGYQTPAPATLTLTEPTTEHTFVYTANTTPSNPTNPTTPTTPAPKHTGAPKLTRVTWSHAKPTLFGLYDSTNTSRLTVTFDGTVYVLGESTELTTEGDTWILNLTNSPDTYTPGTYDLTIQSTDEDGAVLSVTTTITLTDEMLAETGEGAVYVAAGGGALLLLGCAVLIQARRTSGRQAL